MALWSPWREWRDAEGKEIGEMLERQMQWALRPIEGVG